MNSSGFSIITHSDTKIAAVRELTILFLALACGISNFLKWYVQNKINDSTVITRDNTTEYFNICEQVYCDVMFRGINDDEVRSQKLWYEVQENDKTT